MRAAILDLGTNTFHLLIADVKDGKPSIVRTETIAVRLGEGGINNAYISPEAFKRGIQALVEFRALIDQYQATSIKTAATSAIRSATNGQEFLDHVKAETGIHLELIDGDREAMLIYKGVRSAVKIDQTSLIIDIGGGSVEFIICDARTILWKQSYPIGAARLMDRFHKADPISDAEITSIRTYLDYSLADLLVQVQQYKPRILIGSAGAFETFAAFQDSGFTPSFDKPKLNLDLNVFRSTAGKIIKSDHAERLSTKEIAAVRVDMIVVATILTEYIIGKMQPETLSLSSYSLKEGMLFDILA